VEDFNKSMTKTRIVAAMSGGVDSSVSAAILKEQGYEVIGMHMRFTDSAGAGRFSDSRCCSLEGSEDARRVCDQIKIPFYSINFDDEFKKYVIDDFLNEYRQGRTPNPCIRCNQHIKFGFLLKKAFEIGAEYLATGHYARIVLKDGLFRLLKSSDRWKDQSYFLFAVNQHILSHLMFPVGDMMKEKVREAAARFGLPVAEKPESQEICFVPDAATYREYVRSAELIAGKAPVSARGEIVDSEGHLLGAHDGVSGFTIGQRKGLGIARGKPLYVISIDAEKNRVVAGDDSELYRSRMDVRNVIWIPGNAPENGKDFIIRIRYKHEGESGRIFIRSDNEVSVEFRKPVRAITPGQCAVFYNEDEVAGGGWIE
jgi:tRNA-specific 2-thiouridylase